MFDKISKFNNILFTYFQKKTICSSKNRILLMNIKIYFKKGLSIKQESNGKNDA